MTTEHNPLAICKFCDSCGTRMNDNHVGTERIVAVCPLCGWTEAKK